MFWTLRARTLRGCCNTDKDIIDNSYKLVTHLPDFQLWENRTAYSLDKKAFMPCLKKILNCFSRSFYSK